MTEALNKKTVRNAGQAGFTLIELIVGLAVLGLVTAVIGAALNLGIVGTDRTAERLSDARSLRTLELIFSETFTQARPFTITDTRAPFVRFTGTSLSVDVVADSPVGPVSHRFVLSKDGRLTLTAGRTPEQTLSNALQGANFSFWGAKTPGARPAWFTDWRDAAQLPTLVRLSLPGDGYLVARIRIARPSL